MRHRIAITAGLIATIILAYGYWHVSSHGSLWVTVLDVSDREHSRSIADAELRFLDSTGKELAQARAEDPYGVVYLSQPVSYACHEVEKQAPFSLQAREEWDRCFERQSRWLMTWVREVKYVDLKSGVCRLPRIPVSVSEYTDSWWIWWVPLRHIGGKPYTGFRIRIAINRDRCTMQSDDIGRIATPSSGRVKTAFR
jgi:hypothetical protein